MTPQIETAPRPGESLREYEKRMGHRKKLPNMPAPASKQAERINATRQVVAKLWNPSCADIAKRLKISHPTAHTWITEAMKAGAIEPRGNNMNRTYVVAKEKAE